MRPFSLAFAVCAVWFCTACGDGPKPSTPPPPAAVTPVTSPVVAPADSAAMTELPPPPPSSGTLVMPDRRNVKVEAAKQEAVKQRLLALFTIARGQKFAEAAGYVVYRGEDPTRKRWHEVCEYAKDKERVDDVLGRIARLLAKGEPVFTTFEAQKESEGVWLAWHVTFGGASVVLACLEIDGTIALGDISR